MTQKWAPPTIENPVLCLPILKTGYTNEEWTTNPTLSGGVSPEFCRIWQNGPADQSDRELAVALEILVVGFCSLIQACQGRVDGLAKGDPDDYVTVIDWGIEALIKRWLRHFRPNDRWVGEESDWDTFDWAASTWFVDPIDGTRNLIAGNPDVAVHIGIVRCGVPVVSVVGLPFYGQVLVRLHDDAPTPMREVNPTHIVTEYRSETGFEAHVSAGLSARFECPIFRSRCMGKSALTLLDEPRIFYKPKAKLWDVIAPLAILNIDAGHFYDITVTTCDPSGTSMTRPLFGFDATFGQHINTCLKANARVGLVIVVPKYSLAIREEIIKEVASCMSLFC